MKKTILIALAMSSLLQTPVYAKNSEQVGAIVGGVVGGVVGHQIGGGTGRDIATGIGIIAGTIIGSSIGRSMDERDRAAMTYAQQTGLYEADLNRPYAWRGNNCYGNFYVVRTGYYESYQCRSYRSEIYTFDGRREIRSGTTCYTRSGWTEMQSSYVRWY